MFGVIERLEGRQLLSYSTGNSSLQIGDTLYSSYDDHGNQELWKSNLDGSGKVLVKDLNSNGSSRPHWMTEFEGMLYFVANDGHETNLYRSDGTAAGTVKIKGLDPETTYTSTNPSWLTVYKNELYFAATVDNTDYHLFKYNGLQNPSEILINQLSTRISSLSDLQVVNGSIYFLVSGTNTGYELGRTDGTNQGTFFLGDLNPGSANSDPNNLMAVNGLVVFEATTPQGKNQLFTTDGTPGGTIQLYPAGSFLGTIDHLHVNGGLAYFETRTTINDQFEHWQTDGTVAGTQLQQNYSIWKINGTTGNDVVNIQSAGGITTVTINGMTQTLNDSAFDTLEIHLGNGNDTLTVAAGYSKSLAIYGDGGNDSISGGDGDDTVVGGDGDDHLNAAGLGNDTYVGGAGVDWLDYSARLSSIQNGPYSSTDSRDYIVGTAGDQDMLDGFEAIVGSQGDDHLSFSSDTTRDTALNRVLYLDGSGGNDILSLWGLESAAPTVRGGEGNDRISVSNRRNVSMPNSPANADVNHPALPAFAFGDAGDDTFIGDNSANNYYGGDGNDTVDYSTMNPQVAYFSSYRWYFDLNVNHNQYATATLDNITNDGKWGKDNIHSDVELVLGYKSAVIAVPQVNPPAPPSPPPPSAPAPFVTWQVVDNSFAPVLEVNGTTGDDRITLRHDKSDASILELVINGKITRYNATDFAKINIVASNGHDFVDLRDVAIGATILGGNGNDSIYGSQAADYIDGGRGYDLLCGMAGNDSITGGAGRDLIRGGDGVDRIFAHIGVDDINKNKGDTIVNDILG